MMRQWKDIEGLEGRYQVSDDGFVRSLPDIDQRGRFMPGCVLKHVVNEKGYCHVSLGGKSYKVHRLVAAAFIPRIEGKEQVNHVNGNKQANCYSNLEWCTAAENHSHAYAVLGRLSAHTGNTGARCANSKPVRGIRTVDGTVCEFAAAAEAARELGIDGSGISMAARGQLRTYRGWSWEFV